MREITDRIVEYTDKELEIKERFDALLDTGMGVQEAAISAINSKPFQVRHRLDMGFVLHLSDRTVKMDRLKNEAVPFSGPGSPEWKESHGEY